MNSDNRDPEPKATEQATRKLRPGLVRMRAIRTTNGGGVMYYEGQEFVVHELVAECLVKKGDAKRL